MADQPRYEQKSTALPGVGGQTDTSAHIQPSVPLLARCSLAGFFHDADYCRPPYRSGTHVLVVHRIPNRRTVRQRSPSEGIGVTKIEEVSGKLVFTEPSVVPIPVAT